MLGAAIVAAAAAAATPCKNRRRDVEFSVMTLVLDIWRDLR
jgi:hypothetical protein